jgi:hypothetical protein
MNQFKWLRKEMSGDSCKIDNEQTSDFGDLKTIKNDL